MIAFGAILFVNAEGMCYPGLDEYRESAAKGYWDKPRIECASTWFNGPFRLIRRQPIEPVVWTQAQTSTCNLSGGRIAFDPGAIAYLRQHDAHTSVSNFKKLSFL